MPIVYTEINTYYYIAHMQEESTVEQMSELEMSLVQSSSLVANTKYGCL